MQSLKSLIFLLLLLQNCQSSSSKTSKKRSPYVDPLVTGVLVGSSYPIAKWTENTDKLTELSKQKVIEQASWDKFFRENNMKEVGQNSRVQFDKLSRNFQNYKNEVSSHMDKLRSSLRVFLQQFNREIERKVQNPKLIGRRLRRQLRQKKQRQARFLDRFKNHILIRKVQTSKPLRLSIHPKGR